jgi:ABC-type transport system involved in multi-copper enzyme maturation permease subunit
MYLWKCWRDTRSFFLVFLIIAAIVMPVAAVVCLGTHLVEDFGTSAFASTFGLILTAVALGLGAIGAVHEFAEKTAHFLFTKPRSRAYFIWAGWGVGFAEFLAIAAINFLAGWATLSHYSKNPFHSTLNGSLTAQNFLGPLIFCVWAYCLTYSLTVLLRNGLKGLGASMAIVFGLPFFAAAIRWRWHIELPLFPGLPLGNLPLAISNIIWILIAMLFVLGAQIVVERTEI